MLRSLVITVAGVLALGTTALTFAAPIKGGTELRTNPLLKPSPLPFHAPQFNKIKDSDYLPAFELGMKEQRAEVETIANNPAAPTFENTLVALEKSGQLLTRVGMIFNGVSSANTDDTLQKVGETIAPQLAALQDSMYLNDKLFKRVETIYNERDKLKLDPESLRLVEYYYQQFVLAGAKLSDADKAKLKKMNEEEATLVAKFVNTLLAATKAGALVVDNKAALAGLSDSQIQSAAQAAEARGLKGKYVIPLQNTTQQPDLASLTDRATREKLFEDSWNRAERGDKNDTRATIERIAQLRAQEAQLLGYPDYAAWKLKNQMAKTPKAVEDFLAKLVPAATARATREAADIQQVIDKDGGKFKLQPWDWNFYAEQVRKAKYDLDESQIKPYFELNRVLKDGVFYAAHELYGLSFKERHDIPVYQKDVRVFEVFDKDNKPIGLFYCDYYKRDNKGGGAWMDNFVGQSKLLGTHPVIFNVTNFPKPPAGQPTLLSMDDVITMFHEFGHALHGFFADQEYPSLSGTATARDWVEFPSQFNEHWALYPTVFKHYAINYKTGKPMPQELVDKIMKARHFNAGYDMTELLAAAELDMAWHTLPADAPLQNSDTFEMAALKNAHAYMEQVPTRYRSSYYMHIWGNGYASGYYAYMWTEMLADDAYAWFEENGGLTRANGQRFRDMILSRGNTEDYGVMYRKFTGHDPRIEPMLKNRGLTGE